MSEGKMSLPSSQPGLSIIVTSYRRMEALYANLTSLLNQDLRDLPHEIIVVNNAHQVHLRPGRFSKLGRLFRQNPQIIIVNSRHNWKGIARFGMVYLAFFDTVLILDDDFYCLDDQLVMDIYKTLMGLGKYDIVSGWNTIWTHWTETTFQYVNATLWTPELTRLTMTDTCGSGIAMFNKELILNARAQRLLVLRAMPAADMVIGLLSNMLWGGCTYAMPMYKRANFHAEHKKHALHEQPVFLRDRLSLYKRMLNDGYQPVITRGELREDSPEMQLIQGQEPTVQNW